MEVLQSLSSPSPCPHLYGSGNVSVVREHYNWTGRLQNRPSERGGMGATKACFLLISVCIMAENLLVLLAVLFRVRLRHRWVYICIANITLSDLLTGGAYVLNLCMSGSRTFRLSPALWLFREGVLFVALAASIFSLLLIAVERYATMMKPLHQKSARKTCRIYGLVALCWLLAFAIGFLPLLGWNCVCQLESCSTLLPLYSKSYILFSLVIFFIILLAIGVLYGAIYWHVRGSTEMGSTRSRTRSLRLLKTVISIVGAFMVCWGPLFILLLVDFFCESRSCGPLYSADWVIAMAVLNSALNPVIYALGSAELRQAIASLLFCCCVKAGLCDPASFASKETSSTSGGSHRQNSLRNSFNRVRSMSTSPTPPRKAKKPRLSSTTSCLSVSID
ncbi:sphingosine 1-phosphate receptor 4 [Anguilla rostrata]|uniref:sphingosine 1-phosphate receptor 4 n=1 Tax=Anguilla rostrata TaxID=7938 RepID=UPI0030CB1044